MISEKVKQAVAETIQRETDADFILLFGSFAKGTDREDSDVDLAYFGQKRLSPYNRFALASELALLCGRDVDLIDIREVDTVFAMQIFSEGVPLSIQDQNEFTRQQMKAFRMYAELNEQRDIVLKEIKARGSVFDE
ncbi:MULTISPECIES: nucleotidyltransferase domain-containing protein [Exiguobacterium]|uniref:type VII toxin-antitoxin system MntA family adenylyltransferase antitoxin n=1 Tax=Exiguobacterium TaxID=33986 RepID=UPI0008777B15|nr:MULTISPECIES: nucleotidyltransferase domain-containing protein [Exiguobacterium]OGX79078.1 nucleotidyltransferase [Exiguobacterium sp. SH31]TCI42831.1 nucleotidyltransferase domain-containing protein [Exiguobacterium sp. SH5S32]TCI50156.1 nucleotidyltransferase domain-containing protein [Exiguobacterium sp. SH1S4]TCI67555.1 nucleotidyltransferase domain-containing protein [Exiguobacterium sp. SH1S1]TCI68443.1 nucleotidyltransferase domain-containing protein [Exiguobacterium sp. SH0S7]